MKPADSPAQLRHLNHLLALALGSDSQRLCEVDQTIAFIQAGRDPDSSSATLTQCARGLLSIHSPEGTQVAFQHFDLRGHPLDPLWLRPQLAEALTPLGHSGPAVLLISGLDSSIRPPGTYWTRRRIEAYRECQNLIEQLCAAMSPAHLQLSLLFV